MPKHYFWEDKSGAVLKVEYSPATLTDPQSELIAIHVVDRDYKVCGPNLVHMLDGLFILGEDDVGEPFLNTITREIRNERG